MASSAWRRVTASAPWRRVRGGVTWRGVAAGVGTVLAALLILFALVLPNRRAELTSEAFLRVPVEVLLGLAVVLVLSGWTRKLVAGLLGAGLGALMILKIIDIGFFEVLSRPFDPVLDWSMLPPGVEFLNSSIGRGGATAVVVGAVCLAITVLVLTTVSALRLARVASRHERAAARAVAALSVTFVAFAAFGVRVVPDQPAATLAYDNVLKINAGLRDHGAFVDEAAVDTYRDTPGDQLLTALRGKDVIVAFIESYGRDAVSDPQLAAPIVAALNDGDRRLTARGFSSRSGWLTSPTTGGGSWWAHSTLLSGLWINNQQRYYNLVASDRTTLNGAFQRAGWRTVGVMPGITRAWPEGSFYGFDQIYTADTLGYVGPRFVLPHAMPDQFTLSAFERLERSRQNRGPLMAKIPLVSSHAPWRPVPRMYPWEAIEDGAIYRGTKGGGLPDTLTGAARVRTEYQRSISYSLSSLLSYVERYGDDDMVVVFLGDHQPAPIVTGEGASWDVPISIIARDQKIMDRVAGWGWQDGLKPEPSAPVWRMDTFRDRFLATFGPQPEAGRQRPPAAQRPATR